MIQLLSVAEAGAGCDDVDRVNTSIYVKSCTASYSTALNFLLDIFELAHPTTHYDPAVLDSRTPIKCLPSTLPVGAL